MPGIVPLTGGSGPAGSTAPALAAGAAATASPGGLTALIQGIQLPRRPDNFNALPDPQKKWIVDLEEYLRRLMARLGQVTSTIDQIVAAGVKDNRYNAATHTFQSMYFKPDGTAGPWTDWGGDQPVQIPEVVEEVGAPGGMISDLRVSSVYVLEKGTEAIGEICQCGGGGGTQNTCWYNWTSTYTTEWSAPTLAQKYCGTPPPSVPLNQWVISGNSAFIWQQGGTCNSDGDCPTPLPPLRPVCCILLSGSGMTQVSFPDEATAQFFQLLQVGLPADPAGFVYTFQATGLQKVKCGLWMGTGTITTTPNDGSPKTVAAHQVWLEAIVEDDGTIFWQPHYDFPPDSQFTQELASGAFGGCAGVDTRPGYDPSGNSGGYLVVTLNPAGGGLCGCVDVPPTPAG